MIKIDCKKYADEIIERVKQIPNKSKKLVILTAGNDPASEAYMKGKMKDCERCGIPVQQIRVESYNELMNNIMISKWNSEVGGIIVQLPLPDGFDEQSAVDFVSAEKDVDGFKADSPFLPCTPEGIIYVLEKEIGDLSGKTVLLIGKGKLVGKPLINLLLERGCTLTIAHSRTKDLDELTWYGQHDVLITAVGKPNLVDLGKVWADVVIDAGISRNKFGKLCGDCCGDNGWSKVTTVPGGIGLMTRAMLMRHMGEVQERGSETD